MRWPVLVAALLVVPSTPVAAWADGTGGASPDQAAKVTAGRGASGGAAYGASLRTPPVASRFAVSPGRVRADHRSTLTVRIDAPGPWTVGARVELQAQGRRVRSIALGRLATNRVVHVTLPAVGRTGHYRLVLHVSGHNGAVLQRGAHARGVTSLLVVAAPKPPPKPVVTPVAAPVVIDGGVFPVRGPYTFGDGVGAARNGHTHQGQDILAAEQTPVVAPTAGTILTVGYQRSAAGRYVVENASNGEAYFFAHCRTNTTIVTPGQTVSAGQQLCEVGHTGDASGPHLHFEIWVNGWRTSSASSFVDPLPQLKRWAGA